MADFIKSSESLEHDQLGRRESWCSGGADWRSWGQGVGKEGELFSVFSAQGKAIPREPCGWGRGQGRTGEPWPGGA